MAQYVSDHIVFRFSCVTKTEDVPVWLCRGSLSAVCRLDKARWLRHWLSMPWLEAGDVSWWPSKFFFFFNHCHLWDRKGLLHFRVQVLLSCSPQGRRTSPVGTFSFSNLLWCQIDRSFGILNLVILCGWKKNHSVITAALVPIFLFCFCFPPKVWVQSSSLLFS